MFTTALNSKNILIISTTENGHLVKTLQIINYYQNKGFGVHFLAQGNKIDFFNEKEIDFKKLNSEIFGYYYSKPHQKKGFQRWINEWKDRKFDNRFLARKEEIEQHLESIKPSLIFLDIFCISDFLFCYSYSKRTNAKIIAFSCYFPEVQQSNIPPLNKYAFPTEKVNNLWKEKIKKLNKFNRRQSILFPFRSNKHLIYKAMKKLNIPNTYTPIYWERYPLFKQLEIWYGQPEEFDFTPQKLPVNRHYMGPMVESKISPNQDPRLDFFLKLKNKNSNSKLLFCSLGTIFLQLIDEQKAIQFFTKIITIGKENPNWFIAIYVPEILYNKLKVQSINVMLFPRINYNYILDQSDVFISHGGGNSYLEAIYTGTPILAFPPSEDWDHPGVTARIVYHKIGLKADLNDSTSNITSKVNTLLEEEDFQITLKKWKEVMETKYPSNYMDEILSKLSSINN